MRVGQHALKAGSNALEDVSTNNTSIKDALKKHVKNEIQQVNPINRLIAPKKQPKKRVTRKLKRLENFEKLHCKMDFSDLHTNTNC